MTLEPGREAFFPSLYRDEYRITSDETKQYNCVAWAVQDITRCWWPYPGYYWPPEIPLDESVDSFQALFSTMGYVECPTSEPVPDAEKIAIFVDADGLPTHVARQLADGTWTSKLGSWQDIEHQQLEALAGFASLYGEVALIMQRSRS